MLLWILSLCDLVYMRSVEAKLYIVDGYSQHQSNLITTLFIDDCNRSIELSHSTGPPSHSLTATSWPMTWGTFYLETPRYKSPLTIRLRH